MKKIILLCLIFRCFDSFCLGGDSTDNTKSKYLEIVNFNFKRNVQLASPHSLLSPPYGEWHAGERATHSHYLLSSNISARFFFGNETLSRVLADVHLDLDVRILRDNSYSQKYKDHIPWDNSLAVRTPSIKPGFTFYYNLPKYSGKAAVDNFFGDKRKDLSLRGRYLSLKIYHHSNGQDGKHSNRFLYDVVKPRINGNLDTIKFDSPFNVYNGNFAVDILFEPGITFTKNTYKWETELKFNTIQTLYLGYDIGSLVVGEPKLRGAYGLDRLRIRWQRIRVDRLKRKDIDFEKNRLIYNMSVTTSKIEPAGLMNRINTDLTFQFNPFFGDTPYFKNNNISFFLSGGWKGQDDYNIYFQDSFAYFKIGLAMGFKADRNLKTAKLENQFFY